MGKTKKPLLLYLNDKQHQELKEYCENMNVSMNGFVKMLLDQRMREVHREREDRDDK